MHYLSLAAILLGTAGVLSLLYMVKVGGKLNKQALASNKLLLLQLILILGLCLPNAVEAYGKWIDLPELSKKELVIRDQKGRIKMTGEAGDLKNKQGTWRWYTRTGVLTKKADFASGKLSGRYLEYHPKNGRLKTKGEYRGGKKVGTWTSFSSKGKKIGTKQHPKPSSGFWSFDWLLSYFQ